MSKNFNKLVQGLLSTRGFGSDASGKDTKDFRDSIAQFQKAEGLTVTSTVTKETLDALREAPDVPLPRPRPSDMTEAEKFAEPRYMLDTGPGADATEAAQAAGIVVPGNIDITRRFLTVDRGNKSELRTISFEHNGETVLAPTVTRHGEFLDDKSAIDHYLDSGEHLGKFPGPEEAAAYAGALHANEAAAFHGRHPAEPMAGHRHVDVSGANSPFAGEGIETVAARPLTTYRRMDLDKAAAFDDTYEQKWANQSPFAYLYASNLAVNLVQKAIQEGKSIPEFGAAAFGPNTAGPGMSNLTAQKADDYGNQ